MTMNRGANQAGRDSPEKSEGQRAANVLALREQFPGIVGDSAADSVADQALDLVSGEAEAHAYLRNVANGCSRPGELLLLISELEGHQTRGAARVIEKALEARHG